MDPSTPAPPAGHRKRRSTAFRLAVFAVALATVAAAVVAALVLPADAGKRFALPWSAAGSSSGSSAPGTAQAEGAVPLPSASGAPPAASSTTAPKTAAKAAPKAAGPCGRKASAKPATKVTEVKVGKRVTGYGPEGDTDPLPMAIAATPAGGSWLAWRGTDSRIYLGKLGCDDRLVGKPTSFAGIDLQDVQADSKGGVLLLTRRGDCHTGPLCGGTASPCNTMHMIRFDTAGKQVWERQVTNLTTKRGGFDDGARFIWWYQHHGRLATDGTNYAAYFGVAITVKNGSCVDIHEGDRMQVVNAKGALVGGHGSFEVGCSHSWTSRIVWDPRAKRFAMVCATDNACRIAQPNPYRTVAAGTCDGSLFGGDLVLAKAKGYWTAWSQGGRVRLSHFNGGKADQTIKTAARAAHPHLVRYSAGRMLLSWESGAAMLAQVYDAGTGKAVGKQFKIAARDHSYQAFKSYADGSAAYPAAGGTSTSIKVARVLPLS